MRRCLFFTWLEKRRTRKIIMIVSRLINTNSNSIESQWNSISYLFIGIAISFMEICVIGYWAWTDIKQRIMSNYWIRKQATIHPMLCNRLISRGAKCQVQLIDDNGQLKWSLWHRNGYCSIAKAISSFSISNHFTCDDALKCDFPSLPMHCIIWSALPLQCKWVNYEFNPRSSVCVKLRNVGNKWFFTRKTIIWSSRFVRSKAAFPLKWVLAVLFFVHSFCSVANTPIHVHPALQNKWHDLYFQVYFTSIWKQPICSATSLQAIKNIYRVKMCTRPNDFITFINERESIVREPAAFLLRFIEEKRRKQMQIISA